MVFLLFHNHFKLALLGLEAQGAYENLSNKLGLLMVSVSVGVYLLDGFLGFHMDLLALFLGFHMDLLALCDGEIFVLRRDTTLHYTVSHC